MQCATQRVQLGPERPADEVVAQVSRGIIVIWPPELPAEERQKRGDNVTNSVYSPEAMKTAAAT